MKNIHKTHTYGRSDIQKKKYKIVTFQGGISFVDLLCFCSVLCLLCLCARLFICALWSPAGKERTSWLSFVVSNCEFVTFPLVSWVRCGTWLYRFLIFAPLLTFRMYSSLRHNDYGGGCSKWLPKSQKLYKELNVRFYAVLNSLNELEKLVRWEALSRIYHFFAMCWIYCIIQVTIVRLF